MSQIVLDTTALYGDYRLRRPSLKAVLKATETLAVEVLVPEVVLDELVNKYCDALDAALSDLSRLERRLRSLLEQTPRVAKVVADDEVRSYRSWLKQALKANGIQTIRYPTTGHAVLVARALQGRKPFDQHGQKGYRDAIIWESILQHVQTHRTEVLFVSANKADFADEDDTDKLHTHLVQDLSFTSGTLGRVSYFSSLEDLLERAIAPRQQVIPGIREEVECGRLGNVDLQDWLTKNLPKLTSQAEIAWVTNASSRRMARWVIGRIHSVKTPSFSSASHLTESTVLVVLLAQFQAELQWRQAELAFDGSTNKWKNVAWRFIGHVNIEVVLQTREIKAATASRFICLEKEVDQLGRR